MKKQVFSYAQFVTLPRNGAAISQAKPPKLRTRKEDQNG